MVKAVQKKNDTAVSKIDPAMLMEDASVGQEGMTNEDYMIPRLQVLQTNSPQVNKRDGKYIEGAEVGDIMNSVTKDIYGGEKGVTVIPVNYSRKYIEWKPRDAGGGLVKDHGTDSSILEMCEKPQGSMKDITTEGNEVVTTAEYFVYLYDDKTGATTQALISMTSSMLKVARRWNSMTAALQVPKPDGNGVFNPAIFYNAYKLKTVPMSNDKGEWFGWDVEPMFDSDSGGIMKQLKNGDQIYLSARAFREQIKSGDVKVAPEDSKDDDNDSDVM